MEWSGNNVTVCGESFGDGIVNSTLVNVGNRDCRATGLPGHSCRQKPNSSSAEDQGRRAGNRAGSIDRMDRNGKGL